jgi:hypothetical protein
MVREGQESSDGSVGKGLGVKKGWERYLSVWGGWEQGIKNRSRESKKEGRVGAGAHSEEKLIEGAQSKGRALIFCQHLY